MVKNKRGRAVFHKYKKQILLIVKFVSHFTEKRRIRWWEKSRNIKGTVGIAIRYIILHTLAKECGDNVCVDENCFILSPTGLIIGNNVSINPMCYIDATGGIRIGNDVSIAHGTTIMSSTHIYDDGNVPIKEQGIQLHETIIEDNVWVGAKAVILNGVKLAEGTVVGAGAVVTRNTEKNVIVGGVPAKKIKVRC